MQLLASDWYRLDSMRARVNILAGVLTLACSPASEPVSEPSPPAASSLIAEGPDLVLITVESWRADHLAALDYGRDPMPKLERRLMQGRFFTRAIAPSSWTLPSMASIMTGLLPTEHGLRTPDRALGSDAVTTAESLQQRGYRTVFIGSNPWLVEGTGLEQGFDLWDARAGASGDRLVRELEDFLSGEAVAGPLMLHLHFFEPHCKYRPPRRQQGLFEPVEGPMVTGQRLTRQEYESMGECYRLQTDTGEPELELDIYLSRYDAELRATDELIDESLRLLDAALGLDDALVILAGDHGETFWEHGDFGHGRQLYQERVRVPLIVLGGLAGEGAREESPVSLIDIHTTLLAAAGVESSPSRDLRSVSPGVPVFSETEQDGVDLRGAWMDERVVIWDRREDSWKGYSLDTDPGERDPVYADLLLRRALQSRFGGEGTPDLSEDSERGEAGEGALRALGYRD